MTLDVRVQVIDASNNSITAIGDLRHCKTLHTLNREDTLAQIHSLSMLEPCTRIPSLNSAVDRPLDVEYTWKLGFTIKSHFIHR